VLPAEVLVFKNEKVAAWYSLLSPAAVLLMSTVVGYFCVLLLRDPNIVSRVAGGVSLMLYAAYIAYYYFLYTNSRKDITISATLTEGHIEHQTKAGIKRFALCDLVFTMSYSSASILCVILATETDYMVLTCPCFHLFSRNGSGVIKPFYSINEYFMKLNPRHINYVKHKKYRRKNPFITARFLFEIDFYSKRAQKCVHDLREQYRFR
jgi:hypothetical protein